LKGMAADQKIEASAALHDAERSFVEAEVDAVLEAYRGQLPESEIAWMREQLIGQLEDDENLAELARAAYPREVDQSGEIVRTRRG
jgi:hypothetical protein